MKILTLFCTMILLASFAYAKEEKTITRDYFQVTSQQEADDIAYIVSSLGKYTWPELLYHKSSLDKAGDRVKHVHPLKFLMCIFSNEELKASLEGIRVRKKIWNKFSEGLFESLQTESNARNLTKIHIHDFSNTLGIDSSKITPIIQKHNWTQLIDKLMELLPRSGNPGRYDM